MHRGPAPKAAKLGRTPTADWTEVANIAFTGPSPDLPRRPRNRKWHPMVEQWWEQVREMPHCVLWRAVDWTFAVETAFMKQAYWELLDTGEQTTTAAADLHRREDQMGTTLEALRKLRIRYLATAEGDAAGEPELPVEVVEQQHAAGQGIATVTPLAERRSRLTRSA